MTWYTLVLGIPSLFAEDGGRWQPTGWSRKQTHNAGVARKNARLLMKQLHVRGFTHWEVRVSVHASKDYPQHGTINEISEVTDG